MKNKFEKKIYKGMIEILCRSSIPRQLKLDLYRDDAPYICVDAVQEHLTFFVGSSDKVILPYMAERGKVWAWDEMDFVYRFMKTIGYVNREGIFFDCGANVGTTSIYMQKRLGDSFRIFAFEPIQQNYRLLKSNCIINGYEEIVAENVGLSDKEMDVKMRIDLNNLAMCRVREDILKEHKSNFKQSARAHFIRLDDYVEEHFINVDLMKCIWIDTEGHEPAVIAGGENTFKKSKAILYMEYNPGVYRKNGTYESFLNLLKDIYDYFICWEQYSIGKKSRRPISELDELENEMDHFFCNILLIKKCVDL